MKIREEDKFILLIVGVVLLFLAFSFLYIGTVEIEKSRLQCIGNAISPDVCR